MANASIGRGHFSPLKTRGRRRRGTTESETTYDAAGRKRIISEPIEPVFPVPSLKGFLARSGKAASILDHGRVLEVTAGRYAIGLALRLLGIGPGDTVLAPAYHCTVMIDPIVAAGATPVFYRLDRRLDVDLADLEAKLAPDVKAILASHLFGFPFDGPALRDFADKHGLAFIEDCAHAFFGDKMGSYGDYVVGSTRKFFPIAEGGCLVSKRPELRDVKLRAQGFGANISEAVMLIDRSLRFGRLWLLDWPLRLLEGLRRAARPSQPGQPDPVEEEHEPDYMVGQEALAISGLSRLLRRLTPTGRATRKRRENYRTLLDLIGDVPGVRPLFPMLEPGVVPFMAPLWVDRLEEIFARLEDAMIPMQRYGQFLWAGVDETVCPVAIEMQRHLVQLPCHQDLTAAELRRIAGAFRDVVLREN